MIYGRFVLAKINYFSVKLPFFAWKFVFLKSSDYRIIRLSETIDVPETPDNRFYPTALSGLKQAAPQAFYSVLCCK